MECCISVHDQTRQPQVRIYCRNRAFSFVLTVLMLDLVVKASVNLQVISQSIFGSWLPKDWCGRCPRWGHWLNRPTWKVFNYRRICYKQCIATNGALKHINMRQNPNSSYTAGSPQYWMIRSKKIGQCQYLCWWTSTLLDNMMQVSSWLLGKMM